MLNKIVTSLLPILALASAAFAQDDVVSKELGLPGCRPVQLAAVATKDPPTVFHVACESTSEIWTLNVGEKSADIIDQVRVDFSPTILISENRNMIAIGATTISNDSTERSADRAYTAIKYDAAMREIVQRRRLPVNWSPSKAMVYSDFLLLNDTDRSVLRVLRLGNLEHIADLQLMVGPLLDFTVKDDTLFFTSEDSDAIHNLPLARSFEDGFLTIDTNEVSFNLASDYLGFEPLAFDLSGLRLSLVFRDGVNLYTIDQYAPNRSRTTIVKGAWGEVVRVPEENSNPSYRVGTIIEQFSPKSAGSLSSVVQAISKFDYFSETLSVPDIIIDEDRIVAWFPLSGDLVKIDRGGTPKSVKADFGFEVSHVVLVSTGDVAILSKTEDKILLLDF